MKAELNDGKESLEPFHPVLMVIQTFGEPADPISYGRHFAHDPLVSVVLDGRKVMRIKLREE